MPKPGMGSPEYVLTQHAREVLEKRGIPLEWIERALAFPEAVEKDRVDPSLEHRLVRIPERGKVLRVVVNPKPHPMRVVTAFLDRRVVL
ncbi:DUF4258 domain-containing protein [Thermus thermophilus]|uniref:DUF4258 domain-containing protein n=1 Tax=Thermus thermophilus TaxID=274 RepID=UPI001FCA6874|nr:DUF4258 domain-containing protein [Thermus thermophilus]BDG25655.1 hypothetical protein TthSNM66_02910 [Thermus thermophilus]